MDLLDTSAQGSRLEGMQEHMPVRMQEHTEAGIWEDIQVRTLAGIWEDMRVRTLADKPENILAEEGNTFLPVHKMADMAVRIQADHHSIYCRNNRPVRRPWHKEKITRQKFPAFSSFFKLLFKVNFLF